MSFFAALFGLLRAIAIAAAASVAALGLLVVLHPFAAPVPVAVSVATGSPAADDLRPRIDALRQSLASAEAELQRARSTPTTVVAPAPVPVTVSSDASNPYQVRIDEAADRRDIALRQAKAIRDALSTGTPLGPLAGIRDSAMIGQLLAQQGTVEAEMAEQGTRLRANHPVMRALAAQRAAIVSQISAEAANIATALESEAALDDAQAKALQKQLPAAPTKPISAAKPAPSVVQTAPETTALEQQVAAQRAELNGLLDAWLGLKPAAATATATTRAPAAAPLSELNLLVAAVAGVVALMAQLFLASRRVRRDRQLRDLAAWQRDHERELVVDPATPAAEPVLRAAS